MTSAQRLVDTGGGLGRVGRVCLGVRFRLSVQRKTTTTSSMKLSTTGGGIARWPMTSTQLTFVTQAICTKITDLHMIGMHSSVGGPRKLSSFVNAVHVVPLHAAGETGWNGSNSTCRAKWWAAGWFVRCLPLQSVRGHRRV